MKPKFFLIISDHQQSVARPLAGIYLIPPALLIVADYVTSGYKKISYLHPGVTGFIFMAKLAFGIKNNSIKINGLTIFKMYDLAY